MTRQALYNRLIKIAPVIQLAKLKGRVRDDIICLIRNRPTLSISNDVCGWESYDITIIVPDDSIMRLDILYNKVHDMLTTIPEVELVYDLSLIHI